MIDQNNNINNNNNNDNNIRDGYWRQLQLGNNLHSQKSLII